MTADRILCLGDPHIKWNTIPRSQEMIEGFLNLVEETHPDMVVVLGDTLDRFEDVKTTPLTLAVDFLDRLSRKVKTYLLIGNHDYPHPSVFMNAPHPFTALRRWDNLVVVDKVIVDGPYTFVPYVATGRFREALDTVPNWKDSRIIFAHQEFRGCSMETITSKDGDCWDLSLPDVISGHIHGWHRPQSNILYVGSPVQHNFGDDRRKTVSLITTNEDSGYQETRLTIEVMKMTLINLSASELSNFQQPENEMLKLVVHGTIPENNAAKKLQIVTRLTDQGHKVVFKDQNVVDMNRVPISNPKSVRYGQELYRRLEDRKDLQDLYHSLFK